MITWGQLWNDASDDARKAEILGNYIHKRNKLATINFLIQQIEVIYYIHLLMVLVL